MTPQTEPSSIVAVNVALTLQQSRCITASGMGWIECSIHYVAFNKQQHPQILCGSLDPVIVKTPIRGSTDSEAHPLPHRIMSCAKSLICSPRLWPACQIGLKLKASGVSFFWRLFSVNKSSHSTVISSKQRLRQFRWYDRHTPSNGASTRVQKRLESFFLYSCA
jgi:hypothetical protein